MQIQPYTKWHQFIEAVRNNSMCVLVDKATAIDYRRYPHFDKVVFDAQLDRCSNQAAKYVLQPEIFELATVERSENSLFAMLEAGVATHLPHPLMLVEWEEATTKYAWCRRFAVLHQRAPENLFVEEEVFHPFRLQCFSLMKPLGGAPPVAVVNPMTTYLLYYTGDNPGSGRRDIFINEEPTNSRVRVHYAVATNEFVVAMQAHRLEAEFLTRHLISAIDTALTTSLVLLHTRGVQYENVCCRKLNASRAGRGVPQVPDHRIIRIGSVYDRNGVAHQVPTDGRRTMPIHWRSAHNRRVAHGPGRTERKWMHFPAQLINWVEGEATPQHKTAIVKAAKIERFK